MKPKTFFLVGILFPVLLLYVDHVHAANILIVSFFSSKSNKITFLNLVEELGNRGHNITFVTPIEPTKGMKNVKEVFTLDVGKILAKNKFNPFDSKEKGQSLTTSLMLDMVYQVCNQTYDLPQVKSLLQEKFDIVIYQPLFNDCVLGLIHRLQAPFVLFTPTYVPNWILNKVGGHLPSSFSPNFLLTYPPEMNFLQRFLNFGADRVVDIFNIFLYEPKIEQLYREKLGSDVPSINDILANASLVLSNSHFSVLGPRPYLPDVVDVGGIHSRPPKPVPSDMEDFLGEGKNGFILFSMGSIIKGDMMSEEKRKMFLSVFSKLKQQVLWKWDTETMPDLPKNVRLSKWLPQQDLLGHKDIKMFITHCGGGGTEEAIYHGIPLVGIPMAGDQPQNAELARRHGLIVELKWNELTEQVFMDAIQEVLNNSTYRNNAKMLSTLFKDRPMDPLEQGVYWIEYILRHKGAPHLRSAGRKLNTLQYHSYDVIATYFTVIVALLYVLYAMLKFICSKLICGLGKKLDKGRKTSNRKKRN